MTERFPAREVPVCDTESEVDEEYDACEEAATPSVVVKHLGEGFVAEYDLSSADSDDTAYELRDETITRIENDLIDEYVETAEANNREGEVGWSIGSRDGHFVGLPREPTHEFAAELARIARDPESLRQQ